MRGKRQFRRAILDHQAGTVISYWARGVAPFALVGIGQISDIPEDVVEVAAGTQLQVWDLTQPTDPSAVHPTCGTKPVR